MPIQLRENEPMKAWTTFKVGGPARWFFSANTEAEASEAWMWAHQNNIPLFLLGKGSNLVVSDTGFHGLVLHLGKGMSDTTITGTTLLAQAGASLQSAVQLAVRQGLQGMENLAGIPGTIGGGIRMNAGAFDQELVQTVTQVRSIDPQGHIHLRNNAECQFGYRHSLFCDIDELILSAQFELKSAAPEALRQQMEAVLLRRREKQPTELPNAGSMFKRPPGTYAGLLIEKSGLKGKQIGGAAVSEKHSNFVVNLGGATAQDIWELTQQVIATVKKDHGITLEREVIFLGNF